MAYTTNDWEYSPSGGQGVDVWANPDGLWIGGWYDSFVGIERGLLTWAEIDALRKKARRRKSWVTA